MRLPTTETSPSEAIPAGRFSRLGLPHFQWSLTLLGLCGFTFAIVTYRWPIGEVGIMIAALGLVLQFRTLRVPFPVMLYGLFMLWALAASLLSWHADLALEKVKDQLKVFAIMLIVVNALQSQGRLRFYLLFYLGCFILFPVRGTLLGNDSVWGRAVWNYIYSNPNDLASLSLLALGMALGITFSEPRWTLVRLGAGVSAMLLLVVILLTQSRAGFIGLVAGMAPATIWSGLKRPGRLLLGTGVVALVIGFAIPVAVWERLSGIAMLTSTDTIAQADREGSAEQRFEVQKVAWQVFLDNPVFGVGLGVYPLENVRYAPDLGIVDSHNTYLTVAAELGLPGLVLWAVLVGSVLRYAQRRRHLAGPGGLATQQAWIERGLWAFLVTGLFGSYAKLTYPYLVLAILWSSANLLDTRSPGAADPAAARKPPG
jgi:O-antigen ligase